MAQAHFAILFFYCGELVFFTMVSSHINCFNLQSLHQQKSMQQQSL